MAYKEEWQTLFEALEVIRDYMTDSICLDMAELDEDGDKRDDLTGALCTFQAFINALDAHLNMDHPHIRLVGPMHACIGSMSEK